MKHFFKVAFIFTLIIALGLLGVFLVSYFDDTGSDAAQNALNAIGVAKEK